MADGDGGGRAEGDDQTLSSDDDQARPGDLQTTRGNDAPMFSREGLLGGLPARRASTVLFALESRTAALVRASRVNRAAYVGPRTVAEREQSFFAAMAGGREGFEVGIEQLERHADAWAELVPEAPEVRAAVARLLGAKYRFTAALVPGIRRALGLDDPAVAEAFSRLHGAPLSSIYTTRLSRRERLRWLRRRIASRFEALPPFWIAYFLALTETIGEGILIVPVALAAVGPLPAVVLLIVLGLANLITLAALAEAVTRNGSMRYGAAYFGRLVGELLGARASTVQSAALGIFNVVVLFAYLLGFASVFAGATGITEGVWVALLFGIIVFFLRHETLDDTIASAVVIGLVNLSLVVLISLAAATRIDPANLLYTNVPILNGRPIDAATVGLVFGVVLVSFFGHTSVANASKLILTRDPGGRSLLWGNVAALATVIALYCLAVVAIGGALGPEPLVATRGTAITPLAEVVGPLVNVLGSVYVVLAIGIGSIYVALGIYNQVVEILRSPTLAEGGRLARLGAERRWRLVIGLVPVLAVALLLELALALDIDWFAGPIGYVGVFAVPLVGGIFPMLLVAAARRKGEYVPARVLRVVGHPVTVVLLVGLFLTGVLLHGLVIWEEPLLRLAALGVGGGTIVLILGMLRGRRFARRAVVELRLDEARRRLLTVTVAGKRVTADQPIAAPSAAPSGTPSGTNRGGGELAAGTAEGAAGSLAGVTASGAGGPPPTASVTLEPGPARELRVWGHSVTIDGWSSPLPVSVSVSGAEGLLASVERSTADPLLLPLDRSRADVAIRLESREAPR